MLQIETKEQALLMLAEAIRQSGFKDVLGIQEDNNLDTAEEDDDIAFTFSIIVVATGFRYRNLLKSHFTALEKLQEMVLVVWVDKE